MNIRNMKYGISAVCIAALVLLTSGCKRDELEIVNTQDDVIKFAFGDSSLPELKSGADGTSGESRAIVLEGDIDGMVLYRTEMASDSFFGYVSETKGTPVTTENLGDLYMNEFFTTAYDADYNSKFANPVKLAYEEIKEDKSIWRVTESFAWPEKDGKLSFWAWAPNDIVASTKTIKDSEGKMAFTYTMPAPGAETEKKDAEAQKDIILGHTVTGKPDNYIDMNMIHALSGLRFEMDNSVGLKVKNITLSGVLSEGTCTFTPDASKSHAYEQVAWTDLSDKKNYSQDFDQTIISGTGEDEQEIGAQEATFMVIPQCATEISLDLTYEIGGKTKHITANLTGEDWKAGVTYVYNIGHPVFDNYYLAYHWNDGGKHSGDQEIFELEEYTTGGSHDIILQEPYWMPKDLDDYYTFLGWAETPDATEAEYVQPGRSGTGLKTSIKLANEYTNLYAIWQKVEYSGAWINYENYIFNTQQGQGAKFDHIDDWLFNDHLTFTASMGNGYFEKINFPIHGLIPGKWYQMTFSEALSYSESSTDPEKDPNKMWNMSSSYSTTIAAEPNLKSGKESGKLTYYPMIPQMYDYDPHHYVWAKHQSEENGDEYKPMSGQTITFYATSETMYWIWDMSKLYDKNYFKIRFSHSSIDMLPDVNEGTPYVDFPNTSYYGFRVKIDLDKVGDRKLLLELGSSTYKVSADYSNLVMYTLGSSAHEKINVPLKHLVSGKQYKLEFTHKREGYALSNEKTYDYCYAVKSGEVTSTGSSNLHGNNGYSDNITDGTITSSVVFTADAETMYWVWSVSKLCSPANSATDKSMYNILSFYDVTLTQLD